MKEIGGAIPPPVGIGLTVLPNIGEGGAMAPPPPPPWRRLRHHCHVLDLYYGKKPHRLYPLPRLLPNEQEEDEATRKNCRNVSIMANFINSIPRRPYI